MHNIEGNSALYVMTYTLNSGIKNTVPLSNEQIKEWIECYKEEKRYITTIGAEFFGLNSKLVADFKVHNKMTEHRKVITPTQKMIQEDDQELLDKAYKSKAVLIRVDCKCGTAYTTESIYRREAWYCSKCKQDVFLVSDELIETHKGKAYQMSNRNTKRIEY